MQLVKWLGVVVGFIGMALFNSNSGLTPFAPIFTSTGTGLLLMGSISDRDWPNITARVGLVLLALWGVLNWL